MRADAANRSKPQQDISKAWPADLRSYTLGGKPSTPCGRTWASESDRNRNAPKRNRSSGSRTKPRGP
jgi:hypothetical protein